MSSNYRRCLQHLLLLVLALSSGSCAHRGQTLLLTGRSAEHAEKFHLVDVRKEIRGIDIDLRYGTANNVAGRPLYPSDMPCLLRSETAAKLKQAEAILRAQGYGLRIWDAYRPPEAQEILHQASGKSRMFLAPDDGWSRHCGGIAIDLTLVDSQGREQRMPTGFDQDLAHAKTNYQGSDPVVKHNLQVLKAAMKQAGFIQLEAEWWHFDDAAYLRNPQPIIYGWELSLPVMPAP